jgi:hypothetical protein
MKFSSAAQSINARNLRVPYDMRNIILVIIFRVSLTPSEFRFIAIEAHIIKLSIFLPPSSLSCKIWQYNRARHSYNKSLFYSLFWVSYQYSKLITF